MKKVFIYGLADPDSLCVRYIGKAYNPKNRYTQHLNLKQRMNERKREWLESLAQLGKVPVMQILEEVPIDRWREREIYYIEHFKGLGFDLVNKYRGGGGNRVEYKRSVLQLTKDGKVVRVFDSISEAERETGVYFAGSGVLRRKKKSAGGYLWLYKDEYETMDESSFKSWLLWANTNNTQATQFKKGEKSPAGRKVYQYDASTGVFIKEWENTWEAVVGLGHHNRRAIITCLHGKGRGFAIGFFWSYQKQEKTALPEKSYERKNIPVVQKSSEGMVLNTWTSVTEAAKNLKISSASIKQSLYCKKYRVKAGGFYWERQKA